MVKWCSALDELWKAQRANILVQLHKYSRCATPAYTSQECLDQKMVKGCHIHFLQACEVVWSTALQAGMLQTSGRVKCAAVDMFCWRAKAKLWTKTTHDMFLDKPGPSASQSKKMCSKNSLPVWYCFVTWLQAQHIWAKLRKKSRRQNLRSPNQRLQLQPVQSTAVRWSWQQSDRLGAQLLLGMLQGMRWKFLSTSRDFRHQRQVASPTTQTAHSRGLDTQWAWPNKPIQLPAILTRQPLLQDKEEKVSVSSSKLLRTSLSTHLCIDWLGQTGMVELFQTRGKQQIHTVATV